VTDNPALIELGARRQREARPLSVLIVDDHEAMRESIREILDTDPTLTVAGAADGVESAIGLARVTQPDVAIVDVNMPAGGGWAAARGLRTVCPGIRLVAYSSFDEALITRTMMATGISAYVTKGSDIAVLIAVIHGEHPTSEPGEVIWPRQRATAATR